MTREEFIAKNAHLFWYIKKEAIPNIGNEVLVEFIFNYGTLEDVKDLIKIIGFQELKVVYDGITGRKIGNYLPEIYNWMGLIVKRYAT
jgi:flagellin-specific chaperone FliS